MSNYKIFVFAVIALNGFLSGYIQSQIKSRKINKWLALKKSLALQVLIWGLFSFGTWVNLKISNVSLFDYFGVLEIGLAVGIIIFINVLQLYKIFSDAEIAEIENNV